MKISLTIPGQVRGGKNHIVITRTGRRFPNKSWATWRDGIVSCIRGQVQPGQTITIPARVDALYYKGDLRRRDAPGAMDAICHCLERAEIVKDDALLVDWLWLDMGLDRERPRVELTITEK